MKGSKWLRAVFVITAAIVVHALGGGSAQAATPAGAPATHDIVLAGFTAQHYPVFFKVSSDGKAVLSDGIAISMTCASGGTLVWDDTFGHMPVHANGKVRAMYASPTILTNGTASTVTDALTARLNPKDARLSGTWELSASFTFSDGTSDHCDSGPVAFSATS